MSARVQRFDVIERRADGMPKIGANDPTKDDERAMLEAMDPADRETYQALKKEKDELEREAAATVDAKAGSKALEALRANVEKLRAKKAQTEDAETDEPDGDESDEPKAGRSDATEARIDHASAHERMLARIGGASVRVDAGESQRDRIFARLSRGGR